MDEAGATLLDELVRPARAVTDYNTRYSGITAELLATATLSAEEARARVIALARGGGGAADAGEGAEGAEGAEGGGARGGHLEGRGVLDFTGGMRDFRQRILGGS